jgi:hypothetical protein
MTKPHLGLTRQITETPRGEDKPKTVRDSWLASGFPRGTAKQISCGFLCGNHGRVVDFHILFLIIILSYFSLNHGITLSIKSPLIKEDLMISFTIILFRYKLLGFHYK